jgi:hypothetical protein
MSRRLFYLLGSTALAAIMAVGLTLRGDAPTEADGVAQARSTTTRTVSAPGPASAASTRPAATGPTTSATQSTTAPALPEEFAILQLRNPFAKGTKRPASTAARGPGASFVLRGIVEAEGRFTAVFEESASKQVTMLTAGQPIGPGVAKTISMGGVDYEAAGSSRWITVGQNLNGETAPPPPPPTSKPAAPPGGAPAPGQPPGMEMPPGQPPPRPPGRTTQPQPAPGQ